MPFDAEFDSVYTQLIKAPLEEEGFEVTRADSLLNQRSVLADVIRGIAEADLIIADTSGLNPNVLYEMGLAHAMGKPTIMLTQNIDELPFDLRPYRANEYSTNFAEAAKLPVALKEIGAAILAGNVAFSNPVQDYAPDAFSSASRSVATVSPRAAGNRETGGAAGDLDLPTSEEDEPGVFEAMLRLQTGNEATAEVAAKIGEATERIGDQFQAHTARLAKAQANLGDKGAGVYLSIMRDSARDLDEFSDQMEQDNSALRIAVNDVATASTALARARTIDEEDDRASVAEDIEALRGVETSLSEARESILTFANSIVTLPHMDSVLTKAARRAGVLVNETAEILQSAEAEFARARALLSERLGD